MSYSEGRTIVKLLKEVFYYKDLFNLDELSEDFVNTIKIKSNLSIFGNKELEIYKVFFPIHKNNTNFKLYFYILPPQKGNKYYHIKSTSLGDVDYVLENKGYSLFRKEFTRINTNEEVWNLRYRLLCNFGMRLYLKDFFNEKLKDYSRYLSEEILGKYGGSVNIEVKNIKKILFNYDFLMRSQSNLKFNFKADYVIIRKNKSNGIHSKKVSKMEIIYREITSSDPFYDVKDKYESSSLFTSDNQISYNFDLLGEVPSIKHDISSLKKTSGDIFNDELDKMWGNYFLKEKDSKKLLNKGYSEINENIIKLLDLEFTEYSREDTLHTINTKIYNGESELYRFRNSILKVKRMVEDSKEIKKSKELTEIMNDNLEKLYQLLNKRVDYLNKMMKHREYLYSEARERKIKGLILEY